jgi:hypothetical protein
MSSWLDIDRRQYGDDVAYVGEESYFIQMISTLSLLRRALSYA